MKSERTIRRHVAKLRKLCETTENPLEARVAYTMETALRWALGQVAYDDIGSMANEAMLNTRCLEREVEEVAVKTYHEIIKGIDK